MIKRIFILIISFSSCFAYGQTISGHVTFGNYNASARGTSVYVRGKNIESVVDTNGYYHIEVDSSCKTLGFRHIGFETVEINIEDKTLINVVLEDSPIDLDILNLVATYQPEKRQILSYILETGSNKVVDTICLAEGHKAEILKIERTWGSTDLDTEWFRYIYEKVTYPDSAILENYQGKLFVKMIIDTVGYLKNIKILKGIDSIIDLPNLNILKSVPQLSQDYLRKHGFTGGNKYSVIFILPIRFMIVELK